MRDYPRWCLSLLFSMSLVALGAAAPKAPAVPSPWTEKVAAGLVEKAAAGDTEFLVFMAEQAELSGAQSLGTKAEKGAYVLERLTETAARTQPAVLSALRDAGAQVKPLWVANMIWAKGRLPAVEAAARRPEVQRIYANPSVRLKEPTADQGQLLPEAVEWNVAKIDADDVWALGYSGQGVVVGGQDTGYQWDHPALKGHYRGWDGSAANHNYSWHDAIHADDPHTSPGNPCGFDSEVPCDDHGHGTHTAGTMAGDDGAGNQIGVAPGAKWIGCRNMEQGWGNPASYAECFQWFMAPTDLSGANPDPAKAPAVVNNSWGCPGGSGGEGCDDVNVLKTAVENVRAAGIVVVASAGNSGPSCSSVIDPPAIYQASFTVGSTGSSDVIAGSSSRGPVTVDGSNRMKPDIAAPGVSIRSSYPTNTYATMGGTSMAGPHVAGLVALLLSARPDLMGRVDQIEEAVKRKAVPLTTTQGCGGDTSTSVPNNVYGAGRIDALASVTEVLSTTADADGDGVANASDCRPFDISTWAAPSEARDLTFPGPGAADLSWSAPASPGCGGVLYDLLRSDSAGGFGAATCLASGSSAVAASDASEPAAGSAFFYLVRAKNLCGGSLGTDSEGHARTGRSCP